MSIGNHPKPLPGKARMPLEQNSITNKIKYKIFATLLLMLTAFATPSAIMAATYTQPYPGPDQDPNVVLFVSDDMTQQILITYDENAMPADQQCTAVDISNTPPTTASVLCELGGNEAVSDLICNQPGVPVGSSDGYCAILIDGQHFAFDPTPGNGDGGNNAPVEYCTGTMQQQNGCRGETLTSPPVIDVPPVINVSTVGSTDFCPIDGIQNPILTFNISNTAPTVGGAPLIITSLADISMPAGLTLESPLPVFPLSITAGATQTFSYSYDEITTIPVGSNISITSNASTTATTIPVTATPPNCVVTPDPPMISVPPSIDISTSASLAFCPIDGQQTPVLTFDISNSALTGAAPLIITSLADIVMPTGLMLVAPLPAFPLSIAAGDTQTFSYTYDETTTIPAGSNISITSNASTTATTIPVTATPPNCVVTPDPPIISVAPSIDISTSASLAFCPIDGQQTPVLTFSISNTAAAGASPLEINQLSDISMPAGLSLVAPLPAFPLSIAAGGTQTFSYSYDEMTIISGGSIDIVSNDPVSPVKPITVTATPPDCEIPPPVIGVTEGPITISTVGDTQFCPVDGVESPLLTFQIANLAAAGAADLEILNFTDIVLPAGLTLVMPDASNFPLSIAVADGPVTFSYSYDGVTAINGNISITSNDTDRSPATIAVIATPPDCEEEPPVVERPPAMNIPVFGPLGYLFTLLGLTFLGTRRRK